MVDVVTSVEIDRPIEEVAGFSGDPSNAPAWYVNIKEVRWENEPKVAIGSKATFVARFLGRTLTYTYEIVDLVPNDRLVMRTAEGPFPMETTYTWAALADDRVEMTLRNRGEPSGFTSVMAPMMSTAMRRANRKDLDRLKALLEERPV